MGERQPGRLSPGLALAWLALAVSAIAAAATLIGPYPLDIGEIGGALVRKLSGIRDPAYEQLETVLFSVRLPRVAAALLVGAALSAAGVRKSRATIGGPFCFGVVTNALPGDEIIVLNTYPI